MTAIGTQCFDPNCSRAASYSLSGFDMCVEHYIEALEHSAHVKLYAPVPITPAKRRRLLRLAVLSGTI